MGTGKLYRKERIRTSVILYRMIDEKVAIITGGSSGIGGATALALAKEGGKIVVVAARHAKEGKETVRLIRNLKAMGSLLRLMWQMKMMLGRG